MEPVYFLTALDSQYLAHASRDPLGFQTIWVLPARKIIPDLSTVSTSARDFQILGYARYFCQSQGDYKYQRFPEFILRFEQACGYARYRSGEDWGFNGVERVKQRVANGANEFFVSGNPAHGECMLMSNQRSYGVYGKYFRPYVDMKIDDDPAFRTVAEDALAKTDDSGGLRRLMYRLFADKPGEKIKIHTDELSLLSQLVMTRTETEKIFLVRKILSGDNSSSLQGRFFSFMCDHPELQVLAAGDWRFHVLVSRILDLTEGDDELRQAFVEIQNTEKVLYPLWAIFSAFLSNQPSWRTEELSAYTFFSTGFSRLAYPFSRSSAVDIRDELNKLLDGTLPTEERVRALIKRNREVSERRGGLPWVREDNGRYIVIAKGARPPGQIDQENDNVNSYFLPGYFRLFRELRDNADQPASMPQEVAR